MSETVADPRGTEPVVERKTTWRDVLIQDRWRILGVLLLGGALVLAFAPDFVEDFAIPRWLRLGGLTFALGLVLGYVPAARVVAWLYRPAYTYVVDWDARDSTDFAVWELPPDDWRELKIRTDDEKLRHVRALWPAWFGKAYDPELNEVDGHWLGSVSDYELAENREKVDEVRGLLEERARAEMAIRVKQSGIVRKAVRDVVTAFVEGFETETLYRGEAIQAAVMEALDGPEETSAGDAETDPEPGDDGSLTEDNLPAGFDFPEGVADD